MRPSKYRKHAILMFALHLSACTSWQVAPISPREAITEEDLNSARVTVHDGRQLVLIQPQVEGDSISGMTETCRQSELRFGTRACESTRGALVSLNDVETIEVRRPNAAKSFVAVLGGTLATLGFLFLVACIGDDGGWGSPC
jgi:hypothetical protein